MSHVSAQLPPSSLSFSILKLFPTLPAPSSSPLPPLSRTQRFRQRLASPSYNSAPGQLHRAFLSLSAFPSHLTLARPVCQPPSPYQSPAPSNALPTPSSLSAVSPIRGFPNPRLPQSAVSPTRGFPNP
eukprot:2196155-Pleurochrysis_carterae.AAC.1